MYVWSKRLVFSLIGVFVLSVILLWMAHQVGGVSWLQILTTHWMGLNYFLLLVWIFIWMYDQARVRGKNVWLWLVPFMVAPLPTLMVYVLILQRRIK